MKAYLNLILLAAIATIVTACAVNPVTGKKQISFMSEAQEIAMGQQSDPAIIAQYGLYDNAEIQAFINEKGQEMAKISHRPELKYEFKVLDSDVVNAFAVPGGYVYFTRGILAHFNNEAQFAGVLGHEIGHIAYRHSAQQYTKQMLSQIAFVGGMIASEKFRDFAGEAMQGMELLFLKFSRTNESESDILGVDYSSQIGYNAYEMAEFFNTLDRMSGGEEGRLPEFYSTHPDPGRRFTDVKRLTDEWRVEHGKTPADINRKPYLQMIDGLMYGEDPRQGYVENGIFYHPEMKFQYPVPANWQLYNSPSQVQMAPKDGDAMMVLMLSQKKTLAEAAAEITTQYGLKNSQAKNLKIGGYDAHAMVSDYPQESQTATGEQVVLSMQTVIIKFKELMIVFHGLTAKEDYKKFESAFDGTMLGFKNLTDASKINVLPERIKLVEVNQEATLKQVLTQNSIPTDRQEEFAILNGMKLTDVVQKGELIKVMVKKA
jgi:predicted Zn-dependent protease